MWLWEGFPELFAWKALDHAGLYDFETARNDQLRQSWHVGGSLAYLATAFYRSTSEGKYALAFGGTDFLAQDSPQSLISFWDTVGRGTPWQEAFPSEFGITPGRFYEEFASYRVDEPSNPINPNSFVAADGGNTFRIVSYYRIAVGDRPLIYLQLDDESPAAAGDTIEIAGLGVYDGTHRVLNVFTFDGKFTVATDAAWVGDPVRGARAPTLTVK